jgi:hypothetical protein
LIDKDGKVTYSNVARVQTNDNSATIHLYPNPVKATLSVDYKTEAPGVARCIVTDARGTVVRDINLSVQAGRNLRNIDVSSLAPGTYTLRISSNGKQLTSTFIKL